LALQWNEIGVANCFGREFQCRFDIFNCELWVGAEEVFNRVTIGNAPDDYTDGYAAPLYTRINVE
jgi:hypothetical protein